MNWQKLTGELKRLEALVALASSRARGAVIPGGSSPFVSVKFFGAVGNGIANDGPFIQAGLTALAGTGQSLWFPDGTYLVSSAVAVPAGSSMWRTPGVAFTGAQRLPVANQAFVYGAAAGTPAYCPDWYSTTAIGWDPVAGLDTNAGTVASPVATFAEIVRRYGSSSPLFNYGQSVTVNLLSSQPASVDPVFFTPKLSGGGQAVLLGTPIVAAAAFVGGVVTAKAPGAPGTLLQVATMPAGTVAKQLVFNSTRNSYAFIDSMAVLTATMQQPLTTATLGPGTQTPTEDNTWTTGDTLTTYTLPTVNLKRWCPVGADVLAAATPCVGWVQFVQVPDISGTGLALYIHENEAATNGLSMCRMDVRVHISAQGGRGSECVLAGCTCGAAVDLYGNGGAVYGGGCAAGVAVFGNNSTIARSAILHGATATEGCLLVLGDSFSDGSFTAFGGGIVDQNGTFWGSYALTLNPGAVWWNNTGSTFVLKLLTSGALKLGANTTGFTSPSGGTFTLNGVTQVDVAGTFPANAPIAWGLTTVGGTPGLGDPYFSAAQTANAFHIKSPTVNANDVYTWQALPASVTLTTANLDLYNGLQDPNTGARFCNTT